MDWRHHAACREVDPELFFPIGNTGPALFEIEEAKRVCRRCRVIEGCLQWAITGQRRQTRLASSIWNSAGPVFPMGKNSSGSTSRQAAW